MTRDSNDSLPINRSEDGLPTSGDYFQPAILARIARLAPRARYVVNGIMAGNHRGSIFGHSTEFRQHREYTPGDDPRFIDWKVWARQDRLYVKQQQVETNRKCLVLMDVSKSMNYRGVYWSKFQYGATLAVSLAWLSVLRQDAASVLCFDGDTITERTPFRTAPQHPLDIADMLENIGLQKEKNNNVNENNSPSDLRQVFRLAATLPAKGDLVVIVSDLFVDRPAFFEGLQYFTNRSFETVVFHLLDNDEVNFDFTEDIRFQDLESPQSVRCTSRLVQDAYRKEINRFRESIRRGCLQRNVACIHCLTADPLDAVLINGLKGVR